MFDSPGGVCRQQTDSHASVQKTQLIGVHTSLIVVLCLIHQVVCADIIQTAMRMYRRYSYLVYTLLLILLISFLVLLRSNFTLVDLMTLGEQPQMVRVSLSRYPRAVCNDGTPGVYYRTARQPWEGDRYVLYLAGDGHCESVDTCDKRCEGDPTSCSSHMTSHLVPHQGIMSSNPQTNPHFYNWFKASLHYCSSDCYLGNNYPPVGRPFVGQHIMDAMIKDLIMTSMLSEAETVLVVGTRCAGVSVVTYCDHLQTLLPDANVRCVVDSSITVPPPPAFTGACSGHMYDMFKVMAAFYNSTFNKDLDIYRWWQKMATPVFMSTNMWDTVMLDTFCGKVKSSVYTEGWSKGLRQTAVDIKASYSTVGLYMVGCVGHGLVNTDVGFNGISAGDQKLTYSEVLWTWLQKQDDSQVWDSCGAMGAALGGCHTLCPSYRHKVKITLQHAPPKKVIQ